MMDAKKPTNEQVTELTIEWVRWGDLSHEDRCVGGWAHARAHKAAGQKYSARIANFRHVDHVGWELDGGRKCYADDLVSRLPITISTPPIQMRLGELRACEWGNPGELEIGIGRCVNNSKDDGGLDLEYVAGGSCGWNGSLSPGMFERIGPPIKLEELMGEG